jgi:hypothetical protein
MVGDSLMRYQYMALVYWIEFGEPPPPGPGEANSICNEWSWKGWFEHGNKPKWQVYYQSTTQLLKHEHCDCYRLHSNTVENRYYRNPKFDAAVSFLWWTGRESLDPKGHWLWEGSKIGASNCEPGMCAPHQPPIAWSGDHGLWSAVSALQPTETVINCGLWRDCISSPRKANQLANRVSCSCCEHIGKCLLENHYFAKI